MMLLGLFALLIALSHASSRGSGWKPKRSTLKVTPHRPYHFFHRAIRVYRRGFRRNRPVLLFDPDTALLDTNVPTEIANNYMRLAKDRDPKNVVHPIDHYDTFVRTHGCAVKGILWQRPNLCTGQELVKFLYDPCQVEQLVPKKPLLKEMLQRVQATPVVFTNSPYYHTLKVLKALGIEGEVDAILHGHYPHTENFVYHDAVKSVIPAYGKIVEETKAMAQTEQADEMPWYHRITFMADERTMAKAVHVVTHPRVTGEVEEDPNIHPTIIRLETDPDGVHEHWVLGVKKQHMAPKVLKRDMQITFVHHEPIFIREALKMGWKAIHVDPTGMQPPISVNGRTAQRVSKLEDVPENL